MQPTHLHRAVLPSGAYVSAAIACKSQSSFRPSAAMRVVGNAHGKPPPCQHGHSCSALQVIARIHTNQSVVRRLIHSLLICIGRHHPQALMYPLLVACKSQSSFRRSAAMSVVDNVRSHSPILVEQAQLVSSSHCTALGVCKHLSTAAHLQTRMCAPSTACGVEKPVLLQALCSHELHGQCPGYSPTLVERAQRACPLTCPAPCCVHPLLLWLSHPIAESLQTYGWGCQTDC